MRTSRLLFCAALILVVGAGRAGASLKEKSAEYDAKITRELEAANPQAVPLLIQANRAREKEDHRRASDLYAQVRQAAPGFVHAVRRQAMEELTLGNRARAVELSREAVAMKESHENLAALSVALSTATGEQPAPEAERKEALDLARRAVELGPEDFYTHAALAQAALAINDIALLDEAAGRMVALEPEEAGGYLFRSIAQASQGDLDAAERSLSEARRRGMPESTYSALHQAFRDARPWHVRLLAPTLWVLSIWAGGLLLLFLSGWVLSRAALSAASRVPTQASGEAVGMDLLLRRMYKGVLWLSCLYYWLSIPIVMLLVLAVGGGLIYAMFAFGHIPVKLLALVVIVVIVTLASILKSLFARGRDVDPGLRLDPAEEPRLRGLLHEVARKIGTRPVDNIYLTPGIDLAVMERGGMLRQLRGASERCLILGIGVLEGMKLGPFKAILAHEYGHFSNKDTAGGGFALSVRRSLLTMAQHLAEGGAAAWYNPAWLFVNGFHLVFLRISQGASRLQEVLADRWAAFTYGSKSFERGLVHVIERGIRFNAHANATLGEVVEGRRALANLYTYQPAATPDPEQIQTEVKEAIHREPSPYDSHPSPVKRFLWTRALTAPGHSSLDDEEEVWTLFRDREAVERRLTRTVCENLLQQGIELPAEPAAAAAPS